MPTRCATCAGLALWAGAIAIPLGVLCAGALSADAGQTQLGELTARSFALAACVGACAVVLGFVPASVLGTARRGRGVILAVLLVPLLLPRYVLYYAWSLLLDPGGPVGAWLVQYPAFVRFIGQAVPTAVVVLWYWPLAAVVIAQGFARLDSAAQAAARMDAGRGRRFVSVTLPLLLGPMVAAFGVCFALALTEFGAFHLAGIRTVGTELAVAYQLTGSAGAVALAAWPVVLPAVIACVCLARLGRRTEVDQANPPAEPPEPTGRTWRWAVIVVLLAASFVAPVGLLAGHLDDLAPLRQFAALHADGLLWSLAIAATAGAMAMLMAGAALGVSATQARWPGRVARRALRTTILLATFLPGSLVAVALLEALSVSGATAWLRQSWLIVSVGQAVRLGGVALILLHFARDSHRGRLAEMARVDGATETQAWLHVHLARSWPLAAAVFLLVTMVGMTELSATMVLLPAGLPSFAQRLLNQMHYARDRQVIASCLALVATYAVGGALAAILVRQFRRGAGRVATALVVLCGCVVLVGGCDSAPTGERGEVLRAFGQTGRGRGQFIYPRAAALAGRGDGQTVYVVDKAGRIQHLSLDGRFLDEIVLPEINRGKPTGLTVGPDGNIYVADTHYHRVLVYSPGGTRVRQFGRYGQGDGCFIYPTDVAFAADGRMFVSEYGGNDRVSVFAPDGEFIESFGRPGAGAGELSRPSAVCVDDSRGRLYVADACNHRVAVYDLGGSLVRYIASVGRGAGQVRYPYDLALLPDGTLAVCEYGNNRIQMFSPDGRSVGMVGRPGRGVGELAFPWGIVVDAQRRAYVVDAGNNRVQVWQL